MTDLAPHLGTYLQQYLPNSRHFSPHTVQSYTDCFRLLVLYVSAQQNIRPCKLKIEHLSATVVMDFLEFLETERDNAVSTRNIRLAAIKSFFRYLEYREPGCLEIALQIQAIPQKRAKKPLIDWLDSHEMQAILDSPSTVCAFGLRDRAMLYLCYGAALRVSELVSLRMDNFPTQQMDVVRITGKGGRERELPLWEQTQSALQDWLQVRPVPNHCFVFFNTKGQALSSEGFAYILKQHVATATQSCQSLKSKHVTPHVLRHSAAIAVLRSTRDVRKVGLWLGHSDVKTTETYLRVNLAEKQEILSIMTPPSLKPGNFEGVSDKLMKLLGGK